MDLDADLDHMDANTLRAEARRMRRAIRAHRDSSAHELCWHHPDLWALLPEPSTVEVVVPEWPQFMRGCIAYRTSLDEQLVSAPRSEVAHGDT
jgi:hypothetical protein